MINNNLKKHIVFFLLFFCFFTTNLFSNSFVSSLSKKINIGFESVIKKPLYKLSEIKDNFYEVIPKELYRSKQLSAKNLNYYIKKYGIKTIVNLRGVNEGKKWWEKEKVVAMSHDVVFYNIAMNAGCLPSKENIKKLIWIYENAKTPIYVHCQGGADRTGLAVAVYKLLHGESIKKALDNLSFFYGHSKKKSSVAMDKFIKIWKGREWVLHEYDPIDYS